MSIPEASVHDVPVAGEQEAKLDALRSALEAGERSGPAKPLDFDAFIACKRKSAR
nr:MULTISPECIES: type II toxin-antitoxin system ParD family antitoxin [Caballeronia]